MPRHKKGYRFVKDDMTSENGTTKWELGKWNKHKGKIEICKSGFHACLTPTQSLQNIYGTRWFLCEASGEIIHKDDKFVASKMVLIKEIDVRKVLTRYAFACARRSLKYWDKQYPNDKRPLHAIEVAEKYMKNP